MPGTLVLVATSELELEALECLRLDYLDKVGQLPVA